MKTNDNIIWFLNDAIRQQWIPSIIAIGGSGLILTIFYFFH